MVCESPAHSTGLMAHETGGQVMVMQARISTIEGDAAEFDDAVKPINEKISCEPFASP
jgi:hypothetical protein